NGCNGYSEKSQDAAIPSSISERRMSADAAQVQSFPLHIQAGDTHVSSLFWHEASAIHCHTPNGLMLPGGDSGGSTGYIALRHNARAWNRCAHRCTGHRQDARVPSADDEPRASV